MPNYIPFDRNQPYLLPPQLDEWVPKDDVAHFIIAAVDRVSLDAFSIADRSGGKAQYHPRLMLALLIYCYAHGVFSSRRIEQATYRDVGVRFVAANLHPDHDTIAAFRRTNKAAFEAAFLQVLQLAQASGVLRVGTVAIDGTKIDANASKIRSVRYDRIQVLRAKLKADIAELVAKAEAADQGEVIPPGLPEELARREALYAKLDAARAQLEAEALAEAEAARPEYEAKKAARDAKTGRRGPPPKPPEDQPPPDRQINLTDPDSSLMRRSNAHEVRQAYNAQAVVCADGAQLILATNLVATTADAPSFAETVLTMASTVGLPKTVLADTGFASGPAVATLTAHGVDPLVAIGRTQPQRPYDFRPPPPEKPAPRIHEPWRLEMKAKFEAEETKKLYRKRKHTVEPVFGIIKSVLGFTRFRMRGIQNVTAEWLLVALAYNCRRVHRLQQSTG